MAEDPKPKTPPRPAPSRPGGDPTSILQKSVGAQETERDSVDKRRSYARAHLTSRAAILAVVACAIALSLAYPLREYIAQRREIAQLRVQQRQVQGQVDQLARQQRRLGDEAYVRSEARRRLHMCDPCARCYVVVGGSQDNAGTSGRNAGAVPPWYLTLWRSVDAADRHR
jgi:cell division protein FtsB